MDSTGVKALRERLYRGREFTVEHERWKFLLRVPDAFAERRIALAVEGSTEADVQKWLFDLVIEALYGWEGVTYNDLLRDNDESVLEFDAGLKDVLLRERLDIFDLLWNDLSSKRAERKKQLEDATKNSSSASTGS